MNLAPKLSKGIVSPAEHYEGVLLRADLLSRDTASVWKNLMQVALEGVRGEPDSKHRDLD